MPSRKITLILEKLHLFVLEATFTGENLLQEESKFLPF